MFQRTAITRVQPNNLVTRGYRQQDLIGNIPFAHVVFLLWQGRLPSTAEGRIFDAMLVASVDHGLTPPSCHATRTLASVRAPLTTCVAAGIMAITDVHGGAIEDCARLLQTWVERARTEGRAWDDCARQLLGELKAAKQLMPGFGHRLHTQDPRTRRLFALADELGIAGPHVALARALEAEFAAGTRPLPINVDGAIGALISELGFEPRIGKAFFLMGRSAGLVAHALEEMARERPMRPLAEIDAEYDGPWERDLP